MFHVERPRGKLPTMALSPSERIALGLDEPGDHQHVSEFDRPAAAGPLGAPPARVPNPKLTLLPTDKATTPRIRTMVNELLAGNVENADYALKQLFVANPKVALEMYIELAQFTLPKLKAVAVAIDDRSDNPRAVSFAELQKALSGDG